MSHQRILIGRYEVGDLIGRGGMADVYQGRDTRLYRRVAIKLMRPDLARDPQFQSRFRREATSSAALNHPNIVAVFDTGEETFEDGPYQGISCPFIVMEFVDGKTLQDLLRHDEVTLEQAIDWTSGVLTALDYSHQQGIVHRDIKPANVMVTTSGAVKVMDFGIARALADTNATMTQTQAVVGTTQYLSPEQARGEPVDARSDLYSAGCLLFELLTGRRPFVGDSPTAVAYQHTNETAPDPSTLNPSVSEALDAVVACALAKDREDRFQTGLEFKAALARAMAHSGPGFVARPDAAAADTEALGPTIGAAGLAGTAADQPTEAISSVAPAEPDRETATMAMAAVDPEHPAGTPSTHAAAASGAGLDRAPTAHTPSEPVETTGHPLDLDGRAAEAPPRSRGKHRIWVPILVVFLALAAVAGGWFLMDELNRRNAEASRVSVPSVVNLPVIEAQNTLTSADLRPILEEVHDDEILRDRAVGTEPAEGATVQKGQEVTLFISLGPEQVVIPEDLAGQSEATARDVLEGLNLTISSVRYVPSSDVPRDRLVATSPELGATVRSGSAVELQMSSGNVVVPSLIGKTQEEAKSALQEIGLNMTVSLVERQAPVQPGTVVDQEQEEGSEVPQGSSVSVQVARAPAPPSPSPPEPTPTESSPEPTESPESTEEPTDSTSPPPEEGNGSSDPADGPPSDAPTEAGANRGRGLGSDG